MWNWFRSNKRTARAGDSALRELKDKLEQLERTLQASVQRPSEYHINIESLIVDKPVLEQLVFRLDHLDIEELSGSLNLGNNFGTAKGLQPDQHRPEQAQSDQKKKMGAEPSITETPSGYRMRL